MNCVDVLQLSTLLKWYIYIIINEIKNQILDLLDLKIIYWQGYNKRMMLKCLMHFRMLNLINHEAYDALKC